MHGIGGRGNGVFREFADGEIQPAVFDVPALGGIVPGLALGQDLGAAAVGPEHSDPVRGAAPGDVEQQRPAEFSQRGRFAALCEGYPKIVGLQLYILGL